MFLLRLRMELGAVPGLDSLLIVAGLLALLLALTAPGTPGLGRADDAGKGGVAVFALGLDVPEARLAAVLQLVLLVLARLALELAPEDGLLRGRPGRWPDCHAAVPRPGAGAVRHRHNPPLLLPAAWRAGWPHSAGRCCARCRPDRTGCARRLPGCPWRPCC